MNSNSGQTLHQIAPYIGKIRPSLAKELIEQYSNKNDLIWDPFCGSGTIPLEARLLYRNIIASDTNTYACAITRAKLHAPTSANSSISKLIEMAMVVRGNQEENFEEIPQFVKNFFHSQTLKETIMLMRIFLRRRQYFNIGCLLGILHHQRPGFLSYPASHLVPYLRDKLYPRNQFPEAYEYRDPIPRLKAKINRVLKNPPPPLITRFKIFQKSILKEYIPNKSVDAVITSPPYMDILDYARDNRLRLWFLGIDNYKTLKEKEIGKISSFESDMLISLRRISRGLKIDGLCVLILGDVTRNNSKYDLSNMITSLVKRDIKELVLKDIRIESIPEKRRTRKKGRASKKESILVFQRKK